MLEGQAAQVLCVAEKKNVSDSSVQKNVNVSDSQLGREACCNTLVLGHSSLPGDVVTASILYLQVCLRFSYGSQFFLSECPLCVIVCVWCACACVHFTSLL